MRPSRSLILQVGVDSAFHTILVLALFLLLAGHNAPGGGFIGGLVAGAAFVLRYAAEGPDAVRRIVRVTPTVLFGLGLVTAVTTATVPLLTGDALLESAVWEVHPPALGTLKVSSTLAFDAGVVLVVVGLVLMVLTELGAHQPHEDDGEASA